jgi:pantothenate kinase
MINKIKSNRVGLDIGGTLAKIVFYIPEQLKASKGDEWVA